MWRSGARKTSVGVAVAVLLAAGAAAAQSVWAQLGITEAAARAYADQVLASGGPSAIRTYDPFVLRMKEAWYKLPAASRGPAMTGIYALARSYVAAPAFQTAYADTRTRQKPPAPGQTGTVDQEVKARLAKDAAEQEEGFKMLEANGMKAQADQQRQQLAVMQKSMAAVYRAEIEEARAKAAAAYAEGTREWEARFPASANAFVVKHLREFLATTADVDFSAKLVRSPVDGSMGLADAAYRRKPWQWQEAVHYGPEAIAAARAAAAAWLKDLGAS